MSKSVYALAGYPLVELLFPLMMSYLSYVYFTSKVNKGQTIVYVEKICTSSTITNPFDF